MRDNYKLKGATVKIEVEVEKEVAETMQLMEKQSGLSVSEMSNTALKRFITHHSDFMPPKDLSKKK